MTQAQKREKGFVKHGSTVVGVRPKSRKRGFEGLGGLGVQGFRNSGVLGFRLWGVRGFRVVGCPVVPLAMVVGGLGFGWRRFRSSLRF